MRRGLLVHATAVAVEGGAILLRGPSGAGKSDLGLRLIDAGARLIADDQVELTRAGRRILARAPAPLAGLIELRGVGILRIAALPEAPLVLIADLVEAALIERLPEPQQETVLGIAVPRIALAPFEASAAAKLRLARRALTATPAVIEAG
jgi:serine kinase of HPr protein (carbohydrate metabolism regulator)